MDWRCSSRPANTRRGRGERTTKKKVWGIIRFRALAVVWLADSQTRAKSSCRKPTGHRPMTSRLCGPQQSRYARHPGQRSSSHVCTCQDLDMERRREERRIQVPCFPMALSRVIHTTHLHAFGEPGHIWRFLQVLCAHRLQACDYRSLLYRTLCNHLTYTSTVGPHTAHHSSRWFLEFLALRPHLLFSR